MPSSNGDIRQLPPKEPPDRGSRPPQDIVDSNVSPVHGRRVEIHSPDDRLRAMHSGIVKKTLNALIGHPLEIQRIYTGKSAGNIMVYCVDEYQTRKLLDIEEFNSAPVVATLPARWNSCTGTISGRELRALTDGEIIELQNDNNGIIDCFHFPWTNRETKVRENSNTVCLTFDSKILPTHVHIAYIRYPVSRHIPNPMRCYRCQAYGHTNRKCPKETKGEPGICAKCSDPSHNDKDCPVTDSKSFKCINCQGSHAAWSRDCPKFIKEKKVCEYKTIHDVSYFEARTAIFGSKSSQSYAQATTIPTKDATTQTLLSLDCKVNLLNQLLFEPRFAALYEYLPDQRKFVAKPIATQTAQSASAAPASAGVTVADPPIAYCPVTNLPTSTPDVTNLINALLNAPDAAMDTDETPDQSNLSAVTLPVDIHVMEPTAAKVFGSEKVPDSVPIVADPPVLKTVVNNDTKDSVIAPTNVPASSSKTTKSNETIKPKDSVKPKNSNTPKNNDTTKEPNTPKKFVGKRNNDFSSSEENLNAPNAPGTPGKNIPIPVTIKTFLKDNNVKIVDDDKKDNKGRRSRKANKT